MRHADSVQRVLRNHEQCLLAALSSVEIGHRQETTVTRGKYYRGVCDIAKFATYHETSRNLPFSATNREILS